ncbi:hypothetical protein QE152_g38686 [Popillia japonica]|uniref:Double jelly roll-like domain-containing protein n=1 Tax=Popillia japonica TaxID=7064 RepID=A0AAW1HWB2_POPJA
MNRVKSSDASIGEKAPALGVAGIMKAKIKLAINDTFKKNSINVDNKEVLRRVPKRNKKSSVPPPNNNEILNAAMLDVINKRKRNDNVTTIKPQHFLKRKHSIELDATINKKQKFEEDNVISTNLASVKRALSGGAAAIAKAVNQANQAKKQLSEAERHNKTMESIAMGKGLYLKPYKKGLGLYLNEIEAHRRLLKDDDTVSSSLTFVNNGLALLFEEIRYELAGTVIDRNKNPGITSTLKSYVSFDTVSSSLTFVNNGLALLFEEIRYELAGTVIDRNKNPGITSTLKSYVSFTSN